MIQSTDDDTKPTQNSKIKINKALVYNYISVELSVQLQVDTLNVM